MTNEEIIKIKSEKLLNSITLSEGVLKLNQICVSIARKEVEEMSEEDKQAFSTKNIKPAPKEEPSS
jgi:hypothetical protein